MRRVLGEVEAYLSKRKEFQGYVSILEHYYYSLVNFIISSGDQPAIRDFILDYYHFGLPKFEFKRVNAFYNLLTQHLLQRQSGNMANLFYSRGIDEEAEKSKLESI